MHPLLLCSLGRGMQASPRFGRSKIPIPGSRIARLINREIRARREKGKFSCPPLFSCSQNKMAARPPAPPPLGIVPGPQE